jgi:hypothetical protein
MERSRPGNKLSALWRHRGRTVRSHPPQRIVMRARQSSACRNLGGRVRGEPLAARAVPPICTLRCRDGLLAGTHRMRMFWRAAARDPKRFVWTSPASAALAIDSPVQKVTRAWQSGAGESDRARYRTDRGGAMGVVSCCGFMRPVSASRLGPARVGGWPAAEQPSGADDRMIAFFLLLVIVAIVLGIVGVVAKGLLYLLIIGIVVFICALTLAALRMRRRAGKHPAR